MGHLHYRTFTGFLAILALFTACRKDRLGDVELHTGIKRVWAVDDGEKIKREDINNPLATDVRNLVWQDSTIVLFGARNEIIAFQLIIQSENEGARQVDVEVSDLENGSAVIPGSGTGPADPFDYNGRCMELFTEHYLDITTRTPPFWGLSASAMPSAYYSGWVPDCLIPFSAESGSGGAPFNIGRNCNQGVWVDLFIPKGIPPGIYTGKISVISQEKLYDTIPVKLEVLDFELPDSTHIQNMFGLEPWTVAARHGLSRFSAAYHDLEKKYYQMAHRHRMDLVEYVDNLSDMSDNYRQFYTGEAYSHSEGYAGPGELIGNQTFSIGYGGSFPEEYGGSVNNMSRESWWAGSDAWENWFESNAPHVERHKYLFPDEPDWKGPAGAFGTGSMDTIRMQADWTHSNPGPGRYIPCLVTNKIKEELKGFVDFWSVSAEEVTLNGNPAEISAERDLGHKYGIYNGYRPGMGAVVTDADAVEFRVMPWIVWKYGLDQYFYWSVTYWTNKNVFINPVTYGDDINGDGTFLYPGEDMIYPGESRHLKGPLSSIRAKNWRRGAQDYEYLWLAKRSGLGSEAEAIVDACVPKALWEARPPSGVSWSGRGDTFESYRKQLALLLSGNKNLIK